LSFSTGGEAPCPYHKRVLVKWEVRGNYIFSLRGKAMKMDLDPTSGIGRIDCPALSRDGSRCQVDLGPCPVDQIIEHFVLGKPVSRKY